MPPKIFLMLRSAQRARLEARTIPMPQFLADYFNGSPPGFESQVQAFAFAS